MNQGLYKVIFSKPAGQLVVVSESAHAQGKCSSEGVGVGGASAHAAGGGYRLKVLVEVIRWTLASWSIGLLLLGGDVAMAGGVVVPDAANPKYTPGLNTSSTGAPVVNITAPNSAGLSVNQFTQFTTSNPGTVIFNNSKGNVNTQTGGYVTLNPNLGSGPAAKGILAEVTGTGSSNLGGTLEVAGSKADLIIANPNGITVNGLSTVNANSLTLTTGQTVLNADGSASFNVSGGNVAVTGAGGNTNGLTYFDIVARSATIDGPLCGESCTTEVGSDVLVLAGLNQYNYNPTNGSYSYSTTQSSAAGTPSQAIDGTVAGSMYGNSITLISTETGAGVRHAGQIWAQQDITITANGDIQVAGVQSAAGSVKLSGANITSLGDIQAAQDVGITATNVLTLLSGQLIGATIHLEADSLEQSNGTRIVGTANQAVVLTDPVIQIVVNNAYTLTGNLTAIDANGAVIPGAGFMIVNGQLTVVDAQQNPIAGASIGSTTLVSSPGIISVQAGSLSNQSGELISGAAGQSRIVLSGTLDNLGEILAGAGSLRIAAQQVSNGAQGLIAGGAGVTLSATDGIRNAGELQSGAGTVSLTLGAGISTNSGLIDGSVIAVQAQPGTAAGTLQWDNGGVELAAQTLSLQVGQLTNEGVLASTGTTQISVDGNMTNTGQIAGNAGVVLQVGNAGLAGSGVIDNDGSMVSSTGGLTITAGNQFTNENGSLVLANGDVTMGVGQGGVTNLAGADIESQSGKLQMTTQGDVRNNAGLLQSIQGGVTVMAAGTIQNTAGASVYGGGPVALQAGGSITNAGTNTYIYSPGTVSLIAGGALANTSGALIEGDTALTVQGDSVSNDGASSQLVGGVGSLQVMATGVPGALSGTISNTNGALMGAATDLLLQSTGTITNSGVDSHGNGAELLGGTVSIVAGGTFANSAQGQISGSGDVSVKAAGVTNDNALMQAGGADANGALLPSDLTINSSGAVVNSNGGQLKASQDVVIATSNSAAGAIINAGDGVVWAGRNVVLNAQGAISNTGGSAMEAGNALTFTASGDIINSGTDVQGNGAALIGGTVAMTAGGMFANSAGGQISGTNGVVVTAAGVTNDAATILAGGTDAQGNLLPSDLTMNSSGTVVNSNGGQLNASQDVSITSTNSAAGALSNTADGVVWAGRNVTMTAQGSISNTGGGVVEAGNALTLTATGAVTNSGADSTNNVSVIDGGTVAINAGGVLTNSALAQIDGATLVALQAVGAVDNNNASIDVGVINAAGVVTTAGNLTISGAGITNEGAGQMVASHDVTLNSTLNINNVGGSAIESWNAITLSASGSLTNSSAQIQANGQVSGTAASIVNDGDQTGLIAGMDVTLNASGSLSNAGSAQILANDTIQMDAQSFINSSQITASNNVMLSTDSYLNDSMAHILAGNIATLTMKDGTSLDVTSSTQLPTGNAELAVNTNNLTIDFGTIEPGRIVVNAAGWVTNNQMLAATEDLLITAGGALTNQNGGLLWSGVDMELTANSLENTTKSAIESQGNMFMTIASTLNNEGGALIASGGQLSIDAATLNNNALTSGGAVITGSENDASPSGGYDASLTAISHMNYTLSIEDLPIYGSNLTVTPGVIESGGTMYLNQGAELGKGATVNNNNAKIMAGGDVVVDGNVNNIAASTTMSVQAMLNAPTSITLNATPYTNLGTGLGSGVTETYTSLGAFLSAILPNVSTGVSFQIPSNPAYNYTNTDVIAMLSQIVSSGKAPRLNQLLTALFGVNWSTEGMYPLSQSWWELGVVTAFPSQTFYAQAPTVLSAGGNIVSGGGAFVNGENQAPAQASVDVQIGPNGTTTLSGELPSQLNAASLSAALAAHGALGSTQALAPGVTLISTGSTGHALELDPLGNLSALLGNSHTYELSPNLPTNLSAPPIQGVTVVLSTGFGSGASPVSVSVQPIYVTTLPVNESNFYGSQYFFNQVGYNPGQTVAVLADNYTTDQLVATMIQSQVGGYFAETLDLTGAALVQALMNNAGTQGAVLGLKIGVAPTAAQLALATQDFVWYTEEMVDGVPTLVPQVYLCQTTLANYAATDGNATASVGAGGTVAIVGSGGVVNVNGGIQGDMNVASQASQAAAAKAAAAAYAASPAGIAAAKITTAASTAAGMTAAYSAATVAEAAAAKADAAAAAAVPPATPAAIATAVAAAATADAAAATAADFAAAVAAAYAASPAGLAATKAATAANAPADAPNPASLAATLGTAAAHADEVAANSATASAAATAVAAPGGVAAALDAAANAAAAVAALTNVASGNTSGAATSAAPLSAGAAADANAAATAATASSSAALATAEATYASAAALVAAIKADLAAATPAGIASAQAASAASTADAAAAAAPTDKALASAASAADAAAKSAAALFAATPESVAAASASVTASTEANTAAVAAGIAATDATAATVAAGIAVAASPPSEQALNAALHSMGPAAQPGVYIATLGPVVNAASGGLSSTIGGMGDTSIIAKGDILNQGGLLTGTNVNVITGGKFADTVDMGYDVKGNQTIAHAGSVMATGAGTSDGVQISAGGDVNLTAAQIAGQNVGINAVGAINSGVVHVVASTNTQDVINVSGGYSATTTQTSTATAVGSNIQAGNALTVQSGGDLTLEGGNYSGNTGSFSSTGGNVTTKAAQNLGYSTQTTVTTQFVANGSVGMAGSGASGSYGGATGATGPGVQSNGAYDSTNYNSQTMAGGGFGLQMSTDTKTATALNYENAQMNFGSSLSVTAAQGTVDIGGADMIVNTDGSIGISAQKVISTKYDDVVTTTDRNTTITLGDDSSVSSSGAGLINNIEQQSHATASGQQINRGLEVGATIGNATSLLFNPTIGASTTAGITIDTSESTSTTISDNINHISGGNVSITSTVGDIDLNGVAITGGNTVALNAAQDLNIMAAKSTTTSSSSSSDTQIGVNGSAGVVAPMGGMSYASVSLTASGTYTTDNSSSTEYTNSQISGGTVSLKSGGNTTLTGANVTGTDVNLAIGGNLTVTTVQNTSTDNGTSAGFSAGVGVAAQYHPGAPVPNLAPVFNVGAQGGTTYDNETTTMQRSGINASGTLNGTVGGNLNLTGASIGSDTGNGALAVAGKTTATSLTDTISKGGSNGGGSVGFSNTGLPMVTGEGGTAPAQDYNATQNSGVHLNGFDSAGGVAGNLVTSGHAGDLTVVNQNTTTAGNNADITISAPAGGKKPEEKPTETTPPEEVASHAPEPVADPVPDPAGGSASAPVLHETRPGDEVSVTVDPIDKIVVRTPTTAPTVPDEAVIPPLADAVDGPALAPVEPIYATVMKVPKVTEPVLLTHPAELIETAPLVEAPVMYAPKVPVKEVAPPSVGDAGRGTGVTKWPTVEPTTVKLTSRRAESYYQAGKDSDPARSARTVAEAPAAPLEPVKLTSRRAESVYKSNTDSGPTGSGKPVEAPGTESIKTPSDTPAAETPAASPVDDSSGRPVAGTLLKTPEDISSEANSAPSKPVAAVKWPTVEPTTVKLTSRRAESYYQADKDSDPAGSGKPAEAPGTESIKTPSDTPAAETPAETPAASPVDDSSGRPVAGTLLKTPEDISSEANSAPSKPVAAVKWPTVEPTTVKLTSRRAESYYQADRDSDPAGSGKPAEAPGTEGIKTPSDTAAAETPAAPYEGRLVVQAGEDPTVIEAAQNLQAKHADTVFVKLNPDGTTEVISGDPSTLTGSTKVQVVGHGRSGDDASGPTLGGHTPEELARSVQELTPNADLTKVVVMGCDTGECAAGVKDALGGDYPDTVVKGYDGKIDVTAEGRKVAVDEGGLGKAGPAESKVAQIGKIIMDKFTAAGNAVKAKFTSAAKKAEAPVETVMMEEPSVYMVDHGSSDDNTGSRLLLTSRDVKEAAWDIWAQAAPPDELLGRQKAVTALKNFDPTKQGGRLRLNELGLSSLPAHWPDGVKHLNVSDNKITSLSNRLPTTLESFDISNNLLSTLAEGILPNGLKSFSIDNNKLESLPNTMPAELTRLSATRNVIKKLPETLPPLKVLYISGNELTDLSGLPGTIEILGAGQNSIKILRELPVNLKIFDISKNGLVSFPETLPEGLTRFEAKSNQLKSLPILPKGLRLLDVSSNFITGLPKALPEGLEEFNISFNFLSIFPEILPKELTKFDVSDNRITDLPESITTNFGQLTEIDLSRNPLLDSVIGHLFSISDDKGYSGPQIDFSMGNGESFLSAFGRAKGHKYAGEVIPGGSGQALSGHGGLYADGTFSVPKGTTFIAPDLGRRIMQSTGFVVEQFTSEDDLKSALSSGVAPDGIPIDFDVMRQLSYYQVYGPGMLVFNYTLTRPDDVGVFASSTTTDTPKDLSELLMPNMGCVFWSACTEDVRPKDSDFGQ